MRKTFLLVTGFFFGVSVTSLAQKTWIGAGAGGSGTDFNTGSNWSPAGVPTASDNVVITLTSSATITLSASVAINDLTLQANANNVTARLSAGASTLTVNGNTLIRNLSGNGNTSTEIGVNGGTSAGVIDFRGNVTISPTNTGGGSGFCGNANSRLIFRGNLTLGVEAYVNIINRPGAVEFDGSGTQTVTWNNSSYYCEFTNVTIGNTNNPTVNQVDGSVPADQILGNLTINGSSILNLGSSRWNGGTPGGGNGNAGTFQISGTGKVVSANNAGGHPGNNFPSRFSNYVLASASTVEYSAAAGTTQTIFDGVTYGNLILTNSSGSGNALKNAGGNITVTGNVQINGNTTLDLTTSNRTISLGGNWSNNGTFTARNGTIRLTSTTAGRTLSGSMTGSNAFANLQFDGSGSWTLQQPAEYSGQLTLTNGILTTSTANLLTATGSATASFTSGSATSYINGPMAKSGTTDFTFPVGATGAGMRQIAITAPSSSSTFRAQFFRAGAPNNTLLGPGLARISSCEHWMLDRTAGAGSTQVTLSWTSSSPCNGPAYVNDLSTLRVARYNGSQWVNEGNTTTSGTVAAGTIRSGTISSFSPFSLGSSSFGTNPLPVRFTNVRAWATPAGNRIEWDNATEEDVDYYEVQRSLDGQRFEGIIRTAPQHNQGYAARFRETDPQGNNGTVYYRIKGVETTGAVYYSQVVRVQRGQADVQTRIYPNPVRDERFVLQVHSERPVSLTWQLFGLNGQLIMQRSLAHPGTGVVAHALEWPATAAPGIYQGVILNPLTGTRESIRLVKQ